MNVAFLIYNRAEPTARVFAEIRRARPERLLVVADGPVSEADGPRCRAARSVIDGVDWPCEVLKEYAGGHLGCRRRISSGLDWVFSRVEETIILEDDCVPSPSFFRFCGLLLERYRNDDRVWHIGGSRLCAGNREWPFSYAFSRYPMIWGWATWRRAWRHYDVEMTDWPEMRRLGLYRDMVPSAEEATYLRGVCDYAVSGRVDTWDIQWTFCVRRHGALAVKPAVNLVTNIGFGSDASRTTSGGHVHANLPRGDLEFPLRHPSWFVCDARADRRLVETVRYRRPTRWTRLRSALRNPHVYGKMLRSCPIVGRAWSAWRARRAAVSGEPCGF